MSKAKAQKGHFKRRVFERYGLSLNDGEYDYIVSLIRKNNKQLVKFIMKQTNRISVHLVTFKEAELVVVYDKLRSSLCTCLPIDCKSAENIHSYIEEVEEL